MCCQSRTDLARGMDMVVRKIFEYAIQRECDGKMFFEQNAKRMSHAAAISAIERIAKEEQKHIDIIIVQINSLKMDKSTQQRTDFRI
jgi:rubrerythrin